MRSRPVKGFSRTQREKPIFALSEGMGLIYRDGNINVVGDVTHSSINNGYIL